MHKNNIELTARCTSRSDGSGEIFNFYCDLSGKLVYTTMPIYSESRDEALNVARREARGYFNCCRGCGRWVSDEFYDIEELLCSECVQKLGDNKKEGY